MTSNAAEDRRCMLAAARLARRALGCVWPNPSVGALIFQPDATGQMILVGRGVTGRPGTGHAEVKALAEAGERARGGTCYVTLEPCSHFGRTPPCSLALIQAGVSRVVVGMEDPNPRVAGRGIAMLREAGVQVDVGAGADACRELNRGFVSRISRNQPYVFLKMAMSADGYIGRKGVGQIAISGPESNQQVHAMRAISDAILVGIGTVLEDDPSLTCRLPGMLDRSPVRVVIDRLADIPESATLVKTAADVPVWLICSVSADPEKVARLTDAGVLVIRVPERASDNRIDPDVVLAALGARGITRLMVEGGARIAASFYHERAFDRIVLVRGTVEVGEGGIPPFGDVDLETVIHGDDFERVESGTWGKDSYLVLDKKN